MDHNKQSHLIVYGHDFCGQAILLSKALEEREIEFEWRDIRRGEPRFQDELRELAHGYLSVPTVVFPDGSVMVEPLPNEVLGKLSTGPRVWSPKTLEGRAGADRGRSVG